MSNFFLPPALFSINISYMSKARKKSHGGKRPGAGRKPIHDDPVMIAARIPTTLRDQLDQFARAHGLSRSQALLEAIRRLK